MSDHKKNPPPKQPANPKLPAFDRERRSNVLPGNSVAPRVPITPVPITPKTKK